MPRKKEELAGWWGVEANVSAGLEAAKRRKYRRENYLGRLMDAADESREIRRKRTMDQKSVPVENFKTADLRPALSAFKRLRKVTEMLQNASLAHMAEAKRIQDLMKPGIQQMEIIKELLSGANINETPGMNFGGEEQAPECLSGQENLTPENMQIRY